MPVIPRSPCSPNFGGRAGSLTLAEKANPGCRFRSSRSSIGIIAADRESPQRPNLQAVSSGTGAKGLIASAGRYGGTYAHKDIAFEFGSWLSPEFKLYLIKEFQRLKDEESDRLKLGWNLQRTLAKINYRIHTDAIKESLIPPAVTKAQANLVYASEADLLNVALFGQTAKQWRDTHPKAEGNVRDHAPIEQLATWQLAILPSVPEYCRCTPTECVPCLGKPVSSMSQSVTGPRAVIAASA